MIAAPPAVALPYQYLLKNYRVLHHQTLDTLLRYPRLPRNTTNFDLYPINKIRHNHQMTLGGAVTTVSSKTISDAVITETWTAEGVVMTTGFFNELLRFYNAALDSGDHLIWYPADKTEKAFSIQPIDLICGDSNDMAVNPKHAVARWDYRFLTAEVKFQFVIRRIYDTPQAVAIIAGA